MCLGILYIVDYESTGGIFSYSGTGCMRQCLKRRMDVLGQVHCLGLIME